MSIMSPGRAEGEWLSTYTEEETIFTSNAITSTHIISLYATRGMPTGLMNGRK